VLQPDDEFVLIDTEPAIMRFENFTIQNIQSGTSVRWPGPITLDTTTDSINGTNTLLTTNLASINTTYIAELAQPANISLGGVNCGLYGIDLWRHTGWPQSAAEAYLDGTICNSPTCENKQCAGGFYTADVPTFSGYTTNVTGCMVINSSGEYELTKNAQGAPNDVTNMPGITKVCILIAVSNVDFNCSGYNITNDGTLNAAGIAVNGSSAINYTNVTISNCPSVTQYEDGVYIYDSAYDVVRNVTAHNSTAFGFQLGATTYITLHNNTAHNNSMMGFHLPSSSYNTLQNNFAYNNTQYGFYLYTLSDSNNLTNNTAYNNTDGFYVYDSGSNVFDNNTAYRNVRGFHLAATGMCTLSNNTAYENQNGFYIAENGLGGSSNNDLYDNVAHDNTQHGFYIRGESDNNDLYWNTAYGNAADGFQVYDSDNTRFAGDEARGNARGFYFDLSNGVSVAESSSHSNSNTGLRILYSEVEINDTSFHNNSGYDFFAQSTAFLSTVNMTNCSFLNPSGTYENYSTLSINDSVNANTFYSINWTTNSSGIPDTHISFAEKFVNISQAGGTLIDHIVWHWLGSEVSAGGYHEDMFELWKWNTTDGWALMNDSPDTGSNILALTNFNPSSDYGILERTVLECYTCYQCDQMVDLDNVYVKAMNNISNYTGHCIHDVLGENVTFDMQGYNINGSADTTQYAVRIYDPAESAINFTMKDADITNWGRGIYVNRRSYSYVDNVTIMCNSSYSGYYGIHTDYHARDNNFTNMNMTECQRGIALGSTSTAGQIYRNNFTNIEFTASSGSGPAGVLLGEDVKYNLFTNLSVHGVSTGVYTPSTDATFCNSNCNNIQYNTFRDSSIIGNSNGFYTYGRNPNSFNTFDNCNISGNYQQAFYVRYDFRDFSVTNSEINDNCLSTPNVAAFRFEPAANDYGDNLYLENNTWDNPNCMYGIYLYAGSARIGNLKMVNNTVNGSGFTFFPYYGDDRFLTTGVDWNITTDNWVQTEYGPRRICWFLDSETGDGVFSNAAPVGADSLCGMVGLVRTTDLLVENLTSSNTSAGIVMVQSDRNTVRHSEFQYLYNTVRAGGDANTMDSDWNRFENITSTLHWGSPIGGTANSRGIYIQTRDFDNNVFHNMTIRDTEYEPLYAYTFITVGNNNNFTHLYLEGPNDIATFAAEATSSGWGNTRFTDSRLIDSGGGNSRCLYYSGATYTDRLYAVNNTMAGCVYGIELGGYESGGSYYYNDYSVFENNTVAYPGTGGAYGLHTATLRYATIAGNNFTSTTVSGGRHFELFGLLQSSIDGNEFYGGGVGFYTAYFNRNGVQYNNFTNNYIGPTPDGAAFYFDATSGYSRPTRGNNFINNTANQTDYGLHIIDYAYENYFDYLIVIDPVTYAYQLDTATSTNPNNITNSIFYSNNNRWINHVAGQTWLDNLTLARLDDSSNVTFTGGTFLMTNDSNSANTNVAYDFVSINTTSVPEFNRTATVKTYTDDCPTKVMKKYGFPSSRAEILTTGFQYTEQNITYCSGNWAGFTVLNFSGYALKQKLSECFYASTPYTEYVVEDNLVGNKSDQICITINVSNVDINCSGYNVTGNDSGTTFGIATLDLELENITIFGCKVRNYTDDIFIESQTSYINITDNIVSNATRGIESKSRMALLVRNNTAYGTHSYGIRVRSANMSEILNNTARDSAGSGIAIGGDISNPEFLNVTDNIAYNNSQYGITITLTSNSTIRDNVAYGNVVGGMAAGAALNCTFANNLIYDSGTYGLVVATSNWTAFTNITAYNSTYGIYLTENSGADRFTDIRVYNNTQHGLMVENSHFNQFTNVSSYNNTQYGIRLDNATSSAIDGCTMYDNMWHGVSIDGDSTNNNFTSNELYSNGWSGFGIDGQYNRFESNIMHGNAFHGLHIAAADNNFTNSTAYSNAQYGVYMIDSDNTLLIDTLLYNNLYDLYASRTAPPTFRFNATNVTILNPYGTLENYTWLDINDTLENGAAYSINWTTNSTAPPDQTFSFRQKYVNISTQAGNPSIDTVWWHWSDAEVTGFYNETKFELWKYNSTDGWALLNDTPDTTSRILAYSGFNPASDYGIFQNNLSGCQVITVPGTYQLTSNAVGAPNDAAPLLGFVCVKIAVSDVVFSCSGYNITDDSAPATTTYGIELNGSAIHNVTVLDCPRIHNYSYGYYAYESYNNTVSNTTVDGNDYGFTVDASNTTLLNNCTAQHSSTNGFFIVGGSHNASILNSLAHNSTSYGVNMDDSPNATVRNSIVRITTANYGIYFTSSDDASIINNTVHDSEIYGIRPSISDNCNVTGNLIYSNDLTGIYASSSSHCDISDNIVHSSWDVGAYGIRLQNNAPNATIRNNTVYNITEHGMYIQSGDNLIDNNTVYDCGEAGMRSEGGNTRFFNNTIYSNTDEGLLANPGTNLSIIDNNFTGNNYGVAINTVISSTVRNNDAYGNTLGGIVLITASSNTVRDNRVHNNPGAGGIASVLLSNNNVFTNNTVYDHASALYGGIAHIEYLSFAPGTGNLWENNTLWNNSNGFYLFNYSGLNTLRGNWVENSTGAGFYLYLAGQNVLEDNTAYNDGSYGYRLNGASSNTMENNTAYSSGGTGFIFEDDANNNDLGNCTSHSNVQYGISVDSDYNRIQGSSVYENTQDGIYLFGNAEHDNISHSEVYGNGQFGIYLEGSSTHLFENNTVRDHTDYGFYLRADSQQNVFEDNRAYNNTYGFDLAAVGVNYASYNNFTNNTVYENTNSGFGISTNCGNNRFVNNTAHGNSVYGFSIAASYNTFIENEAHSQPTSFSQSAGFFPVMGNTYRNNTAYNNTFYAFYLNSGTYNVLENNTAYNSSYGYSLTEISSTNLTDNVARDNLNDGFYASGGFAASSNNRFYNNSAYNNSGNGFSLFFNTNNYVMDYNDAYENAGEGFYLFGSDYNNLTGNSAYNNTRGFYLSTSTFNRLLENDIAENGFGIYLNPSYNNTILENSLYNNSQDGLWLNASYNNTVRNNTVYNNTRYGFYLSETSFENNFTINNVTYNLVDGIRFAADSGTNDLTDNYVCFNVQLDMNDYNATNAGQFDTCDSFYQWEEGGHAGCLKSCSEVWHYFYGNVSGNILLATNDTEVFRQWDWTSGVANVLAANGDANPDWASLFALGRNVSNLNSTDDFEELDTMLGIGAFRNENVNATFSSDGSDPKEIQTMVIKYYTHQYVPIANSTNSSDFVTGILWDSSNDTDGQFGPTDNEAVIFTTPIEGTHASRYSDSVYYEIRVPGTFDTYVGSSGVVDFYLELR